MKEATACTHFPWTVKDRADSTQCLLYGVLLARHGWWVTVDLVFHHGPCRPWCPLYHHGLWMVITRLCPQGKPPPFPCIFPPHLTFIVAQVLLAGLPDLQDEQATAWFTQGPVFAARGQQGPILVPPEVSPGGQVGPLQRPLCS